MEMEDHNLNLHHHNQYNIDLRHFISSSSASTTNNNNRPSPSQHFPPPHPPLSVDLFRQHHHQIPPHHYDMMMFMPRSSGGGGGFNEFHSDSSTPSTCIPPSPAPPPPPPPTTMTSSLLPCASGSNTLSVAAAGCSTPTLCGLDGDAGSFGGDGGTGRWPRQETLTLLEIRSRLDLKFKEANQKGPLWDEVSRIMSDEHGYQRSGKKCREKFENLYKYYKKTKEGKAGRQDGKHYRFFRQLEALYGDTTSNNVNCSIPESQFLGSTTGGGRFHTGSISTSINVQGNQENNFHNSSSHHKVCDSLSLSNNSSEFDTCSSEDNDHDLSTATLLENDSSEKIRRKRRDGKSWKSKIKDFIDSQMRKLIDRQETWLEKLTKTLEEKEQERVLREEEWRTQEAARVEKEHRFWANERAWIEARDSALMDTLRKLTGKEGEITHPNHQIDNNNWEELEVSRLIQLRNSLEPRFQQSGSIEEEEELWREIARKMGTLGYDEKKKNPLMCKEKWDSISNYNRKMMILSNKKRKENNNSTNSSYYYYEQQQQGQSTTSNSTNNNHQNESCFPFLINEGVGGGENLWENYGLKLSKGGDEHDDHHQDHHDGETTQ